MNAILITSLRTLNDLLTAGIAITAFSLLIYALSFNLKDRVARSFALVLTCVVIVYVADALAGVAPTAERLEFWLQLQWPGIIFLPAAYLHLSDALLATTGRISRGRRRLAVRLAYLASGLFLLALPAGLLVGPLVTQVNPAPYLRPTYLTWLFAAYYIAIMVLSGFNLVRAYRRTVASASRRRMQYLLTGAVGPALGCFPYLLFGSGFAAQLPGLFWFTVTLSNLLLSAMLVMMAYAVAFFGVPWPDRVVKRRLFKWLMRGPVTVSTVLAIVTIINRAGRRLGIDVSYIAPVAMVGFFLVLEHLITLLSPIWERWLFYTGDRSDIGVLQSLEDRLLTEGDIRQFLEAVLAAVADRLQTTQAFIAALGPQGVDLYVRIGGDNKLDFENLSADLLQVAQSVSNGAGPENGADEAQETSSLPTLFTWGDYWLVPLQDEQEEDGVELLGLMGILQNQSGEMDDEQLEAMALLQERAALALGDRRRQQQAVNSLEALAPQMEMIQSLRAAARYDETGVLTATGLPLEEQNLARWVKDALTHYWGGPKLTESPLLGLKLVQEALDEHEGNPTNALRAILRRAIEQTRPEGERRFTAEWILYNILEMKFMEGRKVREIAMRLAMSEADLYRKQRVAIEAVANAIAEMENEARLAKETGTQTEPMLVSGSTQPSPTPENVEHS